MIEYDVKTPTVPVAFHKLLKVVALVDGGISGPEPRGGSVPSGKVELVEHAPSSSSAATSEASLFN